MIPQPYIPTMHNLRVFLLGALWCAVGGLFMAGVTVGDAFIANEEIEWPHVERLAAYGVIGALASYWRKYQALITPVPVDTPSDQQKGQ